MPPQKGHGRIVLQLEWIHGFIGSLYHYLTVISRCYRDLTLRGVDDHTLADAGQAFGGLGTADATFPNHRPEPRTVRWQPGYGRERDAPVGVTFPVASAASTESDPGPLGTRRRGSSAARPATCRSRRGRSRIRRDGDRDTRPRSPCSFRAKAAGAGSMNRARTLHTSPGDLRRRPGNRSAAEPVPCPPMTSRAGAGNSAAGPAGRQSPFSPWGSITRFMRGGGESWGCGAGRGRGGL
jgi:hypothetical protein